MSAVTPLTHTCDDCAEELGADVTGLCGYVYAATYQLLLKIREFDRQELWVDEGICSCAHRIQRTC